MNDNALAGFHVADRKDRTAFLVAAVATAALIACGVSLPLFLFAGAPATPAFYDYLDKVGSYLAGIFSIIGTVWVCATFYVQAQELRHQRTEIIGQRKATEDTARSFRVQFDLAMHQVAIERMAQCLRSILKLCYEDEPEKFLLADTAFNNGATDALFSLAAQPDTIRRLEERMAIGHQVLRYLMSEYISLDGQLSKLIVNPDIPNSSRTLMYDLHPAHAASQVFHDMLSSQA